MVPRREIGGGGGEPEEGAELAPFPIAGGGSEQKPAVAIPAAPRAKLPKRRPGPLLHVRGPSGATQASARRVPTRHLPAQDLGPPRAPLLPPAPLLTATRRGHPPPLLQPPRKRLPMPGGRRHSGALSSPGKPGRAPSRVHPPREPRARVSAGGGDRPTRSPPPPAAPAPPGPAPARRRSPARCMAAAARGAPHPGPAAPARVPPPGRSLRLPSALRELSRVAVATRTRRKEPASKRRRCGSQSLLRSSCPQSPSRPRPASREGSTGSPPQLAGGEG